MNTSRMLIVAATTVLICLVTAPATQAAIGDVVGHSCISKTGTDGCSALPQPDVLRSAATLAVAPDGTDVYVGAAGGIAHFRRAPGGDLSYANCVDVSSGFGDACPTNSAPPDSTSSLSDNAILVTVSPNGKFVYAVSWADSLLWWSRNPATGDLTWGGCKDGATDAATNGHCGTATTFGGGNFPAGSMAFSQGISITPDGATLYIADQQEGLLQAQLSTITGAPTPTACFNNTGSEATGCTALASSVPMAASGLDVGSNSRDIYLRSISPGAITHFRRTAGGTTSFFSCIGAVAPSASCLTAAPNPVFLNSGAIGIAGNDLFSHVGNYGTPSGSVAKFTREADGSLDFVNCATTEAAAGPCAGLPAGTLGGAIGKLAVTTDGSSFYSNQTGATIPLNRFTGSLALGSCMGPGVAGCAAPLLPAPFIVGVGTPALSPDGRQLYQPAAHQINTFTLAGPASEEPPAAVPIAAPIVITKPQIKSVRKLRKGRNRGKYQLKIKVLTAGMISARFEGKLKRGAKTRALSRSVKRSAKEPATYTLYVKPSSTAMKRKLKAKLVVTLMPIGLPSTNSSKSVRLR